MTIEELKQALEVVFKRHAKAVDTRGIRNAPTDWHVGQALDAVIPVLAENAKLLKVAEAAQTMLDAIDKGAVDSEEIVPVPGDGPPYRFHEEWSHRTRKALEELSND